MYNVACWFGFKEDDVVDGMKKYMSSWQYGILEIVWGFFPQPNRYRYNDY